VCRRIAQLLRTLALKCEDIAQNEVKKLLFPCANWLAWYVRVLLACEQTDWLKCCHIARLDRENGVVFGAWRGVFHCPRSRRLAVTSCFVRAGGESCEPRRARSAGWNNSGLAGGGAGCPAIVADALHIPLFRLYNVGGVVL